MPKRERRPEFLLDRPSANPEDGVIDAICNRGHRSFTVIQQTKFEILSDMAIQAIVDGYYRDAIASFMSTLERLYEFFMEVSFRKRGLDPKNFAVAWKPMSKLSERQIGAFIATYLTETGEAPKLLQQKQTELRNDVIHKGKFPHLKETIRFGQEVVNCANPILDRLRSSEYLSFVQTITTERIVRRSKIAWDAGFKPATQSMNTFLSVSGGDGQTDVETAVSHFAKRPNIAEAVRDARTIGEAIDTMIRMSEKTGPERR